MISKYLESKKYAWAESTKKQEKSRLSALEEVLDGNAEKLWEHLVAKGLAPYTRATTFCAVSAYWDFVMEQRDQTGPNPYRTFRTKNRRLFKHVYQRQPATRSYDQAMKAVIKVPDEHSRALALLLLQTGCRYAESQTLENGYVVGKGGRPRKVTNGDRVQPVRYPHTYRTFVRHLAEVGYKPHDLRKIHMTKLAELGATPFEIAKTAGWSSIDTAMLYCGASERRIRTLGSQLLEEG